MSYGPGLFKVKEGVLENLGLIQENGPPTYKNSCPLEKNKVNNVGRSKRAIKRKTLKPKQSFGKGDIQSWKNNIDSSQLSSISYSLSFDLQESENQIIEYDSSPKPNNCKKVYYRSKYKRSRSPHKPESMKGGLEFEETGADCNFTSESEDSELEKVLIDGKDKQIILFMMTCHWNSGPYSMK